MKKRLKKLFLAKETMRNLEKTTLGEAVAGTWPVTYGDTCGCPSYPCGSGITSCGRLECDNACIEP